MSLVSNVGQAPANTNVGHVEQHVANEINGNEQTNRTAKGMQNVVNQYNKTLNTHQLKLANLQKSASVQRSGAKRVFSGLFTAGITEIIRASKKHSISKMQVSINEDRQNIRRAKAGLEKVKAEISSSNSALTDKLMGKNTGENALNSAVREAFAKLHQDFGADIMPDLHDLHDTESNVQFNALKNALRSGLRALPERANPTDVKKLVLECGKEFMAARALNHELGNFLQEHNLTGTNATHVQSSLGLLINEQAEECSNRTEIRALIGEKSAQILHKAQVCNVSDIAKSQAKDTIFNTMSEVLNLPKETITQKVNISKFISQVNDLEGEAFKEEVTAQTGQKLIDEYTKLAHTFIEGKVGTYFAIDDIEIPKEAENIKDIWKSSCLEERDESHILVLEIANAIAHDLDLNDFVLALTANGAENGVDGEAKSVETMHTELLGVMTKFTEKFQEKVEELGVNKNSKERELLPQIRGYAMEIAFVNAGVDTIFAQNTELLKDLSTYANTARTQLEAEVANDYENQALVASFVSATSVSAVLANTTSPVKANSNLRQNFMDGKFPLKYEAAIKQAFVDLAKKYPDDEHLAFNDTLTLLEKLPNFMRTSIREYLAKATTYQSPEDMAAIVKNAVDLSKNLPPKIAEAKERATHIAARIAEGIGKELGDKDTEGSIANKLNLQNMMKDIPSLLPSICRDRLSPDPTTATDLSIFDTRIDNFVNNKIALYNSINTFDLSDKVRDFCQNTVLTVEALKNPELFNLISNIVNNMEIADFMEKFQSPTASLEEQGRSLRDLNMQVNDLLRASLTKEQFDKLDPVDTENIQAFAVHVLFDRNPELQEALNANVPLVNDIRTHFATIQGELNAKVYTTFDISQARVFTEEFSKIEQAVQFLEEFNLSFKA